MFILTFQKIPAANKVTILYQIIAVVIILLNFQKIEYSELWIAIHVIIITILWGISAFSFAQNWHWFRRWNLIFFILINFSELHYLIHSVRPNDLDRILIKLDFILFGIHPTLWLERITFPVLTEYFQLTYITFYFLPIILALLLIKQKRTSEVNFFLFAMSIGFYLSYLGYFMVPAIGPRFTLNHLQSFSLQGLWFTIPIRLTLNTLENIQRDCFPSGHTEMTVLTMYYAFKYHKKYFYLLLIVGTSLIFSTVYLRYHYVVDVIAGILLALLVIFIAPRIYGVFSPKIDGNVDGVKK